MTRTKTVVLVILVAILTSAAAATAAFAIGRAAAPSLPAGEPVQAAPTPTSATAAPTSTLASPTPTSVAPEVTRPTEAPGHDEMFPSSGLLDHADFAPAAFAGDMDDLARQRPYPAACDLLDELVQHYIDDYAFDPVVASSFVITMLIEHSPQGPWMQQCVFEMGAEHPFWVQNLPAWALGLDVAISESQPQAMCELAMPDSVERLMVESNQDAQSTFGAILLSIFEYSPDGLFVMTCLEGSVDPSRDSALLVARALVDRWHSEWSGAVSPPDTQNPATNSTTDVGSAVPSTSTAEVTPTTEASGPEDKYGGGWTWSWSVYADGPMAEDAAGNQIIFERAPAGLPLFGEDNFGVTWRWDTSAGLMSSEEGVSFPAPTDLP